MTIAATCSIHVHRHLSKYVIAVLTGLLVAGVEETSKSLGEAALNAWWWHYAQRAAIQCSLPPGSAESAR